MPEGIWCPKYKMIFNFKKNAREKKKEKKIKSNNRCREKRQVKKEGNGEWKMGWMPGEGT